MGRVDVGAAELPDGERRRCSRVGEERHVGGGAARCVREERRGASEKRGVSGTGVARRDDGEDGCVEEERHDLGGNG
jgi:hypothetical protein